MSVGSGPLPSFQRVLVTGATGFVESALVDALLAVDHEVVALVRSPDRARHIEARGARLAVGDMLQPESYRPLVAEVDAVMHTAQYAVSGRLTTSKMAKIRTADHVMTETLARACLANGKRFLYTSGVSTMATMARSGLPKRLHLLRPPSGWVTRRR